MTSRLGQLPAEDDDALGPILESFVERFRQGHRPSIDDLAARYPEHASQIRELLPAMVEIEGLGSIAAPTTGPHATTFTVSRTRTLPFERLGDYRLLRYIGEGGMGVVYEAVRESLHSRVALKVMHERYRADSEYLRRFHLEARSAASLHHTNIVSVFDYGEHDGICYYAMQFIEGQGLDRVLNDVRLLRNPAAQNSFDPIPSTLPAPFADPLVQSIAVGLVTGRFEPPNDPDAPVPSAEAPTRSHALTRTQIVLNPPGNRTCSDPPTQTHSSPQPIAANPRLDDSQLAPGSTSFANQTESRYFRELARLGAQIADALAHAHKRGILHRDIKPSNILLEASGNAWITDFGLAKFEDGDDLSQSRDLVGTLRYMAPERFQGISDRRGDLYALGATLYEFLTLRPAFTDTDQLRLIQRIIHDPPPSPRSIDRQIPRDLETIVLKAMAKEPKDRFAQADLMANELRRFLDGRPIESRPVTSVERYWRWCQRNPAFALANAAVATLTVAVAIIASIASLNLAQKNERLRAQQLITGESLDRAHRAETDLQAQLELTRTAERSARLELGKSLLAEGAAIQTSGQMGQRFTSLERLAAAADVLREQPEGRALLPDVRDHAITALGLTDVRPLWTRDFGLVDAYSYTHDRSVFALGALHAGGPFSLQAGEITVRRQSDDSEILRLPHPGVPFWYWNLPISEDGRFLAAGYTATGDHVGFLDLWDLKTRERVFRQPVATMDIHFDRSSRWLSYRPSEGGLTVWDLANARQALHLPIDSRDSETYFDSNGRVLVSEYIDETSCRVRIFKIESGEALHELRLPHPIGAITWSQDGRWLAMGSSNARIFVWNLERDQLVSELRGHGARVTYLEFSPVDSSLLISTGWDAVTCFWNATTGTLSLVAPGVGTRFSPDGRSLGFYLDTSVGQWELAHDSWLAVLNPSERGNRVEREPGEPYQISHGSASFGRNDQLLAIAAWNGAYVYDLRSRTVPAFLPGGVNDCLLFAPDGSYLLAGNYYGFFRWPIRSVQNETTQTTRIGPPALIRETVGDREWRVLDLLPDHHTAAIVQNGPGQIELVDVDSPLAPMKSWPSLKSRGNHRMTSVALSPDGQWAAAGGWKELGISIWDLSRRTLVRLLEPSDGSGDVCYRVAISPNGRWLASNSRVQGNSGIYLWEVGTWDRRHFIPAQGRGSFTAPLFRHQDNLLAVAIDDHTIALIDPDSGRTLVKLRTLDPLDPAPLAFSRSGTMLAATTNRGLILIWDLARIHRDLAPLRLPWDDPVLESPPPTLTPVGLSLQATLEVEGAMLPPAKRRVVELAEANRTLELNPHDLTARLRRAWLATLDSRPNDAIADLAQAAAEKPSDPELRSLIVQSQLALPGSENSIRVILEDAIAALPDNLDFRRQFAALHYATADFHALAIDAEWLLDHDSQSQLAHYWRGVARLRIGQPEAALSDLEPLLKANPNFPTLHALHAEVQEALGHHDIAARERQAADSLLPQDPATLNERAWAWSTSATLDRDPESAVLWARKAVQLDQSESMYLNTLGVALYRAGNFREAVEVLRRSRDTGGGEFDGFDLYFIAMALTRLDRPDEAREAYEQADDWHKARVAGMVPKYQAELAAFQAEASTILGLDLPGLPARVFVSPSY